MLDEDADDFTGEYMEPSLDEDRRRIALDLAARTCGPDCVGDRVLTVARRYEAYLKGEESPPPALAGRLAAA